MVKTYYYRMKNIFINSIYSKKKTILKTTIIGTFCLFLYLWIYMSNMRNNNNNSNVDNDIRYPKNHQVNKIVDLLKFDIRSYLEKQNKVCTYFNESNRNVDLYVTRNITGYVSNLNLKKYFPQFQIPHSLDSSNNKFISQEEIYENFVTCKDLQYDGVLHYQVNERKNKDDLIGARRQILSWNNEISEMIQNKEEEANMSEEEIIEKHWFEFGHMSIWSESEDCYLTFSRIIYTQDAKNLPKISLIRATAYDRDWNEIIGRRIPYSDVLIPNDFEEQMNRLDEQLAINQCKQINKENFIAEHHECLKRHNDNILRNEQYKRKIFDKYFLTYPTVLKFHFRTRSDLSGPEDPHVIIRKDHFGRDEPIVIFNLDDGSGRKLHSIFPHKRTPTLVKFLLPDSEGLQVTEKNWSPFFIPKVDYPYSKLSFGYIHFVYSFMPLRILRCSLDNGNCDEKFSAVTLNLSEDNAWNNLRGGTQFVPLPTLLPSVKGKSIWISFAKTHTKDCGCGPNFYRPALVIMVEENGIYHLDLIASGIDFGIEPMDYEMTNTKCRGKNVLTPNSIVSWYIESQDISAQSFEDFLTITVSEADSITKRVVVKGVLDYILNMYKQKDIDDFFPVNEHSNVVINATRHCVRVRTLEICQKYGLNHPVN